VQRLQIHAAGQVDIEQKSIRLDFFGLAEGPSIHPPLEDLELCSSLKRPPEVIQLNGA
jgi:hypothetical protein